MGGYGGIGVHHIEGLTYTAPADRKVHISHKWLWSTKSHRQLIIQCAEQESIIIGRGGNRRDSNA